MIRPLRSEEVKGGKSPFAIIRTLMGRRRKLSTDKFSTSKKLSRYQILSKPYLNRHRWTGISVPRRARKLSLRNSAIQLDVPLVDVLPSVSWGAVNDARRLFNKNTGLCKVERRCIGADTCPVLVSQPSEVTPHCGKLRM